MYVREHSHRTPTGCGPDQADLVSRSSREPAIDIDVLNSAPAGVTRHGDRGAP
jgi:hypothetical protein